MTGWNMPPGCNVSDIPGNGPGDGAGEALYEKIYDILSANAKNGIVQLDDQYFDEVAEKIFTLCEGIRADAFKDGVTEERLYHEWAHRQDDERGPVGDGEYQEWLNDRNAPRD